MSLDVFSYINKTDLEVLCLEILRMLDLEHRLSEADLFYDYLIVLKLSSGIKLVMTTV